MTKATFRNGRSSKISGVYNANHNTLEAVRRNEYHIDNERMKDNIYWSFSDNRPYYNQGGNGGFNAKKRELEIYEKLYHDGIEARNKRYLEKGKKGQVLDMKQVINSPKTAPMETIWQIGDMNSDIPREERKMALLHAFSDSFKEIKAKYGDNMKFLDAALHMDEKSPHIHSRCTLGAVDKFGHFVPNQNEALKQMGFERPDPSKPLSRYNSPIISFTDEIREIFYKNCEKQGLKIDREVKSASHRQEEVLDYKIKQMQGEIERLTQENTILADKLKDFSKKAEEAEQKIAELEAQREKSENEASNAKLKADRNKEKADIMEKAAKKAEKEAETAVQRNQELTNETKKLEKQLKSLQEDLEKAKKSDKEYEEEISKQIFDINALLALKRQELNEINADIEGKQEEKAAIIEAVKEIEKYQKGLYLAKKEFSAKILDRIPEKEEKRNLFGKVTQEAEPEKVVMAADEYDRLTEKAKYTVMVDFAAKNIEEFDKKVNSNQIIRDKDTQISDMQIQINGLNQQIRKMQQSIQSYAYFLQQRGLEQEFYDFGKKGPEYTQSIGR